MLFRVGLTLVRLALGTTEQRLACPGLLETLGALRAIPPTQLQEEVFMSQVGAPPALPSTVAQPLLLRWGNRVSQLEVGVTPGAQFLSSEQQRM